MEPALGGSLFGGREEADFGGPGGRDLDLWRISGTDSPSLGDTRTPGENHPLWRFRGDPPWGGMEHW